MSHPAATRPSRRAPRGTGMPRRRADKAAAGEHAAASDAARMLRHWIESVPNDRLAHLAKDATRAFVRALSVRLDRHDVSFGHWTFLRVLWERDGLTQRELSLEAGVMEPTTFQAVSAMEARGYVVREHRPGNRKNVYVNLTAQGRALKRKLVPLAEEVNRLGLAGISSADVATTRNVLIAIIANLAREATNAGAAPPPEAS